jgi:hypothetical protein
MDLGSGALEIHEFGEAPEIGIATIIHEAVRKTRISTKTRSLPIFT